jgi:adenine-specific DNA-methyltransferase
VRLATAEAKANGSYYTPSIVARTLVRWAVRRQDDRLLDPSCGDGEFLRLHPKSIGIERDKQAAILASHRAPGSMVHVEDFFAYAGRTNQRFDCATGNPPFIRYQQFAGDARRRALEFCHGVGVPLSALSSSWAPFLVAAVSLLRSGGRAAFVVPAEIGHASYVAPLMKFLCCSFRKVHLIAIRQTVFTRLSQDVWLLYADGYGGTTSHISFTAWDKFRAIPKPPGSDLHIAFEDWQRWGRRIRPFLLPRTTLELYERLCQSKEIYRLGDVARVGIGYVSGANDFFHLSPSQAIAARIPDRFLIPTVRSGRVLPKLSVTAATVGDWIRRDSPCLLLRIQPNEILPSSVRNYLISDAADEARKSYKCSNRTPWYVVPDVNTPDGFLSYMSGEGPSLVANIAGCTGTNSVHVVRMKSGHLFSKLQAAWSHPLTRLSVELEGHPLGGGMLKLEPREAARIALPQPESKLSSTELQKLCEARVLLRKWRHYE